MRRFTESALARTRDMCLPFRGVLVSRADDPSNGFVFRSLSCSGDCSSGTRCSHCASQTLRKEIRQSVESDVQQRAGKRATIQNIANNPILAATEIRMLREEVRSLRSQLARTFCLLSLIGMASIFRMEWWVMRSGEQLMSWMHQLLQHCRMAGILRHLSSGDCTASTSARCIRMVERVEAGRQ